MPASSAMNRLSKGENISHFTGVRMRVTGVGDLQMVLRSFDDLNEQTLVPFTLSNVTSREPFRLSNFNEQRASLQIQTTELRDRFRINRIALFTKPVATGYPGIS